MPDWCELQTYIRLNLKMLSDGPDAMVIGWQHPQEAGEPTRQALYVFKMTAYGEPWLVLLAPVCPEELVSARNALLLSSELTIGALVVHDGAYALRATFSTKSLPLSDITLCMERLAWAAVALREHFMEGKPLLAGQPPMSAPTDPPLLHNLWAD